jgi:1-deoxy-D-xylulose-5-phosphate reductoisomerase
MKKKIVILGSTGSIGNSLLNIIKKDKEKFEIVLLTANSNYKKLLKQAETFNVKNLIITEKKGFQKIKNKLKKINIYNNFESFEKIFKKKVDYTMSAISGLDGLIPTNKMIKYTKVIAIANKESIICGWNLLQKELKKNKTKFIPVDSEHFSIWYGLNGISNSKNLIKKLYLTASGGPFINYPVNKLRYVKIHQALKHPNWKMGKKISIDSATMMNKVFEIIEAKNIFNIDYKKLSVLIHTNSYVHAILKFKNGLIKIIAHDTNMQIPIFNTLYENNKKSFNSKNLQIHKLNHLDLKKVDLIKFPYINIIKLLPKKNSLFETALVSANDTLVNLFLSKKIKYMDMQKILLKLIKTIEFKKYKYLRPRNVNEIIDLSNYVRLKIISKSV